MSGNHKCMDELNRVKKFARQELLAAADSLYDKECATRIDIGSAIDLPEYKARQRAIDAAERIHKAEEVDKAIASILSGDVMREDKRLDKTHAQRKAAVSATEQLNETPLCICSTYYRSLTGHHMRHCPSRPRNLRT